MMKDINYLDYFAKKEMHIFLAIHYFDRETQRKD